MIAGSENTFSGDKSHLKDMSDWSDRSYTKRIDEYWLVVY
jgi:hypothetical protein